MTPFPVPALTVILPTHNPHAGRLRGTLTGLAAQTLPHEQWELLIIDNASSPPVSLEHFAATAPLHTRLVTEPKPGLSHARRRGFTEARGNFAVLVDDDNVLAPDYLACATALFAAHPRVGALGGKSLPEFETPPPDWATEFFPLLALRDLGPTPIISSGLRPPGATLNTYPPCAPIGAGMALRRAAWEAWLRHPSSSTLTDRCGGALTSGGDNDIVFRVLRAGWEVAYCPELSLTHLIPSDRLSPAYLARLNYGIQKSWQQVLRFHDASPWPTISRWTVPMRKLKAWFSYRAWRGIPEKIRWRGACGHFEGRAIPSK